MILCFDWSRGTVRPGSSRPDSGTSSCRVFTPHCRHCRQHGEGAAEQRRDRIWGWVGVISDPGLGSFLVSKRATAPVISPKNPTMPGCAWMHAWHPQFPHTALLFPTTDAVRRQLARRRMKHGTATIRLFPQYCFHCWTTSKNHNHFISPIDRSDTLIFF